MRIFVALLRLYRLTLAERAIQYEEEGRPCCAAAIWDVERDVHHAARWLTDLPPRSRSE